MMSDHLACHGCEGFNVGSEDGERAATSQMNIQRLKPEM